MDFLILGIRYLAAILFAGALIWATIGDLRTFEVSNRVHVVVVGAFLLLLLANGFDWRMAQVHGLTGGIVLVVCFGLFSAGVVGAGDAKLLSAIALWMGWPALLPYLFYVALTGGVVGVLLILFRRRPLSPRLAGIRWVRQLHERKKDIPYAVAVSLPALFLLPGMAFPTGVAAG